jgi:microcystin-dependent protein
MSDQFIGEIRAFAFAFPPVDWVYCNGQTFPFQQSPALYALIGNIYGPTDTRTYFTLPDLRGRAVIHPGTYTDGTTFTLGQTSGVPTVTLNSAQLATHNHTANSANSGSLPTNTPSANVYPSVPRSGTTGYDAWTTSAGAPSVSFSPNVLTVTGGGGGGGTAQPHNNISPYLAFNFCIAINGNWPARN